MANPRRRARGARNRRAVAGEPLVQYSDGRALVGRYSSEMHNPIRVSGAVMAGGVSRRLGRDKALESIGGKPLIERVLDTLTPLTAEILVVLASPEQAEALPLPPSVRVLTDVYPKRGSLGGIFTGLRASAEPWSLVVACDMPFLNPRLLRHLIEASAGVDAVIPRLSGRPEPLHALYSKACLAPMERMLRAGQLKVAPLFDTVKVRYLDEEAIDRIDPKHLSFFNINTQADLEEALRLARQQSPDAGSAP